MTCLFSTDNRFFSPQDEYLQTATRRLTIEELHQRALDTRALHQEFWVRKKRRD